MAPRYDSKDHQPCTKCSSESFVHALSSSAPFVVKMRTIDTQGPKIMITPEGAKNISFVGHTDQAGRLTETFAASTNRLNVSAIFRAGIR